MTKQNSMAGLRHFFWGFDGTLLDTYPLVIEDLRLSLQEYCFDGFSEMLALLQEQ